MIASHDYSRLYHRGMRGIERRDRSERRYQQAMCVLLTFGLIGALWAVGVLQ